LSPSTNLLWIRCVAVRVAVRAVVRAVVLAAVRVAVHVAVRVAVCLRCLFESFFVDEVLSPSTHLLWIRFVAVRVAMQVAVRIAVRVTVRVHDDNICSYSVRYKKSCRQSVRQCSRFKRWTLPPTIKLQPPPLGKNKAQETMTSHASKRDRFKTEKATFKQIFSF